MSGIVGIFYLDGRPVEHSELKKMTGILAHRGPDGEGIWHKGSVGLGHRMLWTTPESLTEQLPKMIKNSDLSITADARIDNRDELIATLNIDDRRRAEINDSSLILTAYEKWGKHCPEKLLGDFTFAIWDGRRRHLFCARDHFGVKPFYYYFTDKMFAFGSEIKAIISLSEIHIRINKVKVAEYLASIFDNTSSTFYEDLFRLPPAHSMLVKHNGVEVKSYWSLNPGNNIQLASDEEYAKAFREIFTEAVRCRLRSALPVGSMLSGGLDSSSVTCVASNLLAKNGNGQLKSFSGIFSRVTKCDERRFINEVLAKYSIEPHYIFGDKIGPLTFLDEMLWFQDEPFYAPHLFMHWKLNGKAKNQGVRIILDGFDGDTTISHGLGYLHELARAKRWHALYTALKGLEQTMRLSPRSYMLAYIGHYGFNPIIDKFQSTKLIRRAWRGGLRRWRNRFPSSANPKVWEAVLKPDFIEQTDLDKRHRAWRKAQPSMARNQRDEHYRDLKQGLKTYALEVLDKASAAFSIQTHYPFWDKRLVEFCLAIPPDQKLFQSWSRVILRRAMGDFLPLEVQWRRDKTDFTPNFLHGLLTFERDLLEDVILNERMVFQEFIDISAMHEVYNRFISQKHQNSVQETMDARIIFQVASLSLWLKNQS